MSEVRVPSAPITLYRHALSGHCHRVEVLLSVLRLPYTLVDVDLLKGAHKQPEFLAMNPFGLVPVIDDNGTVLHDSNAILVYLASRYDNSGRWLPRDPLAAAKVQQWLSYAAGPLANGPGAARLVKVFGAKKDHEAAKLVAASLLTVLDGELSRSRFAIGEQATIADLAAYAYIAHAPEGEVSLEPYPNVRGWLARVEALEHFVPMRRTPAA